MSLKNSTPTGMVSGVTVVAAGRDILLMPCSVALEIFPSMISPLKGRKTIRRNFTESSVRKENQREKTAWTNHSHSPDRFHGQ